MNTNSLQTSAPSFVVSTRAIRLLTPARPRHGNGGRRPTIDRDITLAEAS
jgi:hypothetical protein